MSLASVPFGLGVVIGKFLPPHAGHHLLIDTALAQCSELVVFVCERPTDPIPGQDRAEWLREVHPTADIRLIDDRYDENDSRVWADNTLAWLGRAPDAVFTSEAYGDAYAGHLKCRHVLVDQARLRVPCSGTAVRNDPFAHWHRLAPPVRAWYAKRIVCLGAESTGTTTLARDLAETLATTWVPEYGRDYSILKQARADMEWRSAEFEEIAREQTRLENLAARSANKYLICDTNAFATALWHRRYLGFDDAALTAFGLTAKADLYLLTGDEIPFVQDGLRDGEAIRHEMHQWFVTALNRQAVPWLLLRGSPEQRLAQALAAIQR
jgi:NadR type nicotinamide-nucleotide adenylyltransferase